MNQEILKKYLFQMTGEEIIELFSYIILKQEQVDVKDYTSDKHAFGLIGLANLLRVSKTKAQQIKNSGILDAAITQHGRKIMINKELALQLYKDNSKKTATCWSRWQSLTR